MTWAGLSMAMPKADRIRRSGGHFPEVDAPRKAGSSGGRGGRAGCGAGQIGPGCRRSASERAERCRGVDGLAVVQWRIAREDMAIRAVVAGGAEGKAVAMDQQHDGRCGGAGRPDRPSAPGGPASDRLGSHQHGSGWRPGHGLPLGRAVGHSYPQGCDSPATDL